MSYVCLLFLLVTTASGGVVSYQLITNNRFLTYRQYILNMRDDRTSLCFLYLMVQTKTCASTFFWARLKNCEKLLLASSCLSVCPHGKTLLPLDGFLWNLIFWVFFENLSRITGTLHEDVCTFMLISRWILLRMRNASDKRCTENQNTHFMFNNFFPKIVPFMR
jgi:hypothetical protein